jgi:hypothetical protein
MTELTEEQWAFAIRAIRDELILAWQGGIISDLLGAEKWMNARVYGLSHEPTITGDTTEGSEFPIPSPRD